MEKENSLDTRDENCIFTAAGAAVAPVAGVVAERETEPSPLHIDLKAILASRMRRKLPAWLVGRLERIIHQRELNEILEYGYPGAGWVFASRALRYLDITVTVRGLENIPAEGRFVFASNHPLGGLDGIALIALLGRLYGDEGVVFPVNDMLMNVRPLKRVFVPINKFGSQSRDGVSGISDAYASDKQVMIFPAGLVSRLGKAGIKDLMWHKSFVVKAAATNRLIIPIFFDGLNSMRFYRCARWRKRLGIKFNMEQVLLPGEVCRARGKHFTINIGKPIDPSSLNHLPTAQRGEAVKEMVYAIG